MPKTPTRPPGGPRNHRPRRRLRPTSGPQAGQEEAAIGRQMRRLRLSLKLTPVGMGKKLGVSANDVNDMERGKVVLHPIRLLQIARTLGVSLTEIYGKPWEELPPEVVALYETALEVRLGKAFRVLDRDEKRILVEALERYAKSKQS